MFGTPIISYHNNCDVEKFTESDYKKLDGNVTLDCHTYHKRRGLKWFENKARIINKMGVSFIKSDFPELTNDAFRQNIHRLGNKVVKVIGGRYPNYRFFDINTGFEKPTVTLVGMRVGLEFEKLLLNAEHQYPQIHDVKLYFSSENLHSTLVANNFQVDPTNHGIMLPTIPLSEPNEEENTYAKVMVYPESVHIDIACTYLGIIYDIRGALRFVRMLEKIRNSLQKYSTAQSADIPDPLDWIITHYHFAKDGNISYAGERFEIKVEDFSAGLIRFYSKQFQNGQTITRLEQARTPKNTVKKEIETMEKIANNIANVDGPKYDDVETERRLRIIQSIKMDSRKLLKEKITNSMD